jgi:hypothetical protein
MIKNFHIAHPFLFAVLPAVFLWGQNFGEVPIREVFPALIVFIIFGALAWGFFWIFFRDFEKSAAVTSAFLIVTLFFGYIYEIFFYNSFIKLRFLSAFIILFVIITGIGVLIKKTKKDLYNLNKIITITIGIFILLSLFQVITGYYNSYTDKQHSDVEVIVGTNDNKNKLRDIYYIVLDGYSSPDVISSVMGFKEINQTVNSLEQKGFFVASESKSNYPGTLLSLPSSLNMRYLEDPSAHKIHFTLAENHKAKDFLKSQGYKYLHFGADAFTYFNRYADENINLGLFSPYQTAVWHNTIFRPIQDLSDTRFDRLAEKFGFLDRDLTQWKREKFKLKKLAEVPGKESSPVFAFAHFLVPKGANVFDENGDFLTKEEADERGVIKNYLGHVAYINKEVESLVDTILENSDHEPIIVIQGDHGFPFWGYRDVIEEFDKPELAKELIVPGKYSFPIFNAYYFPDGGDKLLYDSVSPVNTFRILLNYYFGQDLELLDDTSYTADPDDSSKFIIWDK